MRVYIAIDFENNIKDYFSNVTSHIKNYCTEGSFTEIKNFHLTICFIGEADNIKISQLKEVLDRVVLETTPFELLVNNLGIFKRKKTNILWIGIEENVTLFELHKKLSTLLKEFKIPFYDKPFMPHITLGRRILFPESFQDLNNLIEFEKISISVKSISLMASKEENGKLNGVPIYKVNLN